MSAEEEAGRLVAAGNAAEDDGRLDEALQLYRQAVELAPHLPATHLNLGIGLAAAGEQAAAADAYERVLALEQNHPFGCYNHALLRYRSGELHRADELVRRALATKPDFPQALLLLSNILDDQEHPEAAVLATREALQMVPQHAGAHHNLALLLKKTGDSEGALAAVERALALDAGRLETHSLHADLLAQLGVVEEALKAIRGVPKPGGAAAELALSKEVFYSSFDEDADPAQTFALHQAYGRMVEATRPAYAHAANPSQCERRLRIGYLSGDFRAHPVALFMIPVLDRHDRAAFEVFCYATGEKRDHITAQVQALADHWKEVRHLGDEELAREVQQDGIDILVDLSGHSGAQRLGTMAFKPAPVQVSWLGYLNTTGLTRMDYRLCDVRTDPPEQAAALHTEKLLYLPHSQWCYRPFMDMPRTHSPPLASNGFITFGSFNQASKVTMRMVRRWAAILRRVPNSRLLLADMSSPMKVKAVQEGMAAAGVQPDRLEFVPRTDVESYYRLIDRADIALDTYPYTGGTTTFDALSAGVPVVTATGPTSWSRSAASILAALGLRNWIADGIDEYVEVAVRRAADHEGLRELRRKLSAELAASPLMDEPRFVQDLESLFRQVWRAHCNGRRAGP